MSVTYDHGSIEPIEEVHVIGGVEYILREANGVAAAAYRAVKLDAAIYDDEGEYVRMEGRSVDAELVLVAGCLFHKEDGAPVPLDFIKTWPDRITQSLFNRAFKMSGMEKREEPEGKE